MVRISAMLYLGIRNSFLTILSLNNHEIVIKSKMAAFDLHIRRDKV